MQIIMSDIIYCVTHNIRILIIYNIMPQITHGSMLSLRSKVFLDSKPS